ncbi:hypothetical protein Pcinc_026902 [Petrolisthes cinctipes]|uniref:Adipose-secreted signaling protein n=1 Tax=Petrolisthes cinctipes TaxID=88211 RepID=A0AAE1F5K4_PETCI|nr:hypothetical protein Pcinc_026902 [Petrolisthes cinctipes]
MEASDTDKKECGQVVTSEQNNDDNNKAAGHHHHHHPEHHVHFSEDTDEVGHTRIVVKEKAKDLLEAHVGFLQILHRYRIIITLPFEDADEGYQIGEIMGVHCHVGSLRPVEGGLEVQLDLMAYKEKLLKETLLLLKPSGGSLKLIILARVLGKGKGTPMLREGITCIEVEHDEESEGSDWQGF